MMSLGIYVRTLSIREIELFGSLLIPFHKKAVLRVTYAQVYVTQTELSPNKISCMLADARIVLGRTTE